MSNPPQAERFHPGEYVGDELKARGWSIETFCERSGLRRDLVDELIAGRRSVTRMTAFCLAQAFGSSEQTWLRLQKSYDEGPSE